MWWTRTHSTKSATRRGVCQDLTHIFIAAARHLEVPARYVSGYFHRADGVTEQPAANAEPRARRSSAGWRVYTPEDIEGLRRLGVGERKRRLEGSDE